MNQIKSKKSLLNWELVSVNPNDKNWDWKDLFCFWSVNIQSVIGFSLITSLYLIYDLNTLVVFTGTIFGSILVYFFSNWIGAPSQKFGLPFVVLLRSSLGVSGARYLGLLRGLVGIFMFGIQTYFLSKAFSYLIRIFFFSVDSTFLQHDIFLIFISFNSLMFSGVSSSLDSMITSMITPMIIFIKISALIIIKTTKNIQLYLWVSRD